MIRKWMTTLLALMLAVMMPVFALADTQHTFSVLPGELFAADDSVAALLDSLSLTLVQGKESGALRINAADNPVATVAVSADVTGLYVQSNLLSDDVLYVTWDDGFAVLGQLAASQMDAADAQAFQQELGQYQQLIVSALQNSVKPAQPVSIEDEMAAAAEMFKDDPEMLNYLQGLTENMQQETGLYTAPQRDPATGKQVVTFTNEDLLAVCNTGYMRSVVQQVVSSENPELTGAELNSATDAMLEEVRQIYRDMELDASVTVYTVDDGMTIVGMEIEMPMTVSVSYTDESGAHTEKMPVSITADYNRLTDANGVSHKAGMLMNVNGEEAAEVAFDLYKGVNGVSTGALAMLVEGEEITIAYNASNEGDVRTRIVELYQRSGATAIISPAPSARPLIGFRVVTEPADRAVLQTIENATSETAVNVMKLSETQMDALFSDVQARAMQAVFAAMNSLPTDAMMVLMNMLN